MLGKISKRLRVYKLSMARNIFSNKPTIFCGLFTLFCSDGKKKDGWHGIFLGGFFP